MGIVDIPDESNLIIRLDTAGFGINNRLIRTGDYVAEDDRPANTYEYFMEHLFSGTIEVGSKQGNTRSYANYEYIMYHKSLAQ